jgi:hypothetical protein
MLAAAACSLVMLGACAIKAPPTQDDVDFVQQLEDAGLDLAVPHEMRHTLIVDDEHLDDLVELLEADGYSTRLESASTDTTRVVASRDEIIDARRVRNVRRDVADLILNFDGEYVSLEVLP